ncbi:Uncharacterized protein Rs2_44822 [Raphanus sativus]|nr:Uncharacterized protein Rs2_44822 [Raphanus sativus]
MAQRPRFSPETHRRQTLAPHVAPNVTSSIAAHTLSPTRFLELTSRSHSVHLSTLTTANQTLPLLLFYCSSTTGELPSKTYHDLIRRTRSRNPKRAPKPEGIKTEDPKSARLG